MGQLQDDLRSVGLTERIYLLLALEEGIPSGEEGGFLFEQAQGGGRHIFLVHHQAEGVFVKPSVGHDQVAAHPVGRAPRVLHLPLAGLAVFVQIHGAERHGVARSRSEGADAVGLRHGEGRVEEIAVVEVVERQDARLAIVELAHIAGVVHARAVLDRGDGHLLDFVHRQIDVRPVVAVVGVAIEIDGIGLVIGA